MNYLLLSVTTVALAMQSVFAKQYQRKVKGASVLFAALSAMTALLFFWALSGFQLRIEWSVLPYAVAFAVAYSASVLALVIAIGCGKLSLTALINSYSLVIPTLYGVLFLDESLKTVSYIGFALLAISLFMVNYAGKQAEDGRITLQWIIAVLVAFLGNGMCSTIQKAQQLACDGKYKNEFMVISLFIAVILLSAAAVCREKAVMKTSVKSGGYLAMLYGLCNGIVNLLVMVLGGRMPVSIMFPVISAGSIVLTAVISLTVYRERLHAVQLVGVLLGVLSIICLNL